MLKMRKIKKKQRNRGSAVLEITLLIPVFLGCIYFYIMLFLFFVESGKRMEQMSECLYQTGEEASGQTKEIISGYTDRIKGKTRIAEMEEKGKLFDIRLEMKKD